MPEISVDVTYDLLEQPRRDAIKTSAEELLHLIEKLQSQRKDPLADYEHMHIWPALGAYGHDLDLPQNYQLTLLPLSRIGADQGFSGSSIVLGYFKHSGASELFPSQPMVIKLRKKGKDSFGRISELRDELHRANRLRPYIGYHKDQYALPLHITDGTPGLEYQVLWSPFALTDLVTRTTPGLNFSTAPDLRQLLAFQKSKEPSPKSLEEALSVIKSTFHVLEPLHKRAGTARSISTSFSKEYELYLRGFGKSWGKAWRRIWGEEQETQDFGTKWVNPIRVLEELLKQDKISLRLGAVHGDLHPGNILYAPEQFQRPFLIDFGWADDNAHIAKDYVLLECNLRFIYFPADVPFETVTRFAQMNGRQDAKPERFDERFKGRVSMIDQIRQSFIQLRGNDPDWMTEYIIPLFLVSFGLLKFTHQYSNQIAARLTILELAKHISENFLKPQRNY
jgi:hypothetical protein